VGKLANKIKLGFLGFGEAAYEMSLGFTKEGLKNIVAYDKDQNSLDKGKLIKERIYNANVQLVSNVKELANNSNLIISAVTCANAILAAESIGKYLSDKHIFVDINATSPNTKKKVGQIIQKSKAGFVDVAAMNPIPKYRHKVPMLISGNGAEKFQYMMRPYNMNLAIIKGGAGVASSIKMLRSIFMKGMAALLVEMLTAAEVINVRDFVVDSIKGTLSEIKPDKLIHRLIAGTAIHAQRRVHEMEEVIETLNSVNIDPIMSIAAKDVLSKVDALNLKEYFGGKMPEDYVDVVKILSKELPKKDVK